MFDLIVFGVLSKSTFIGNAKKRAELFELTDNEVAVFRITLPDNEFAQLKEEVSSGMGMPPPPPGMGGDGALPPPGMALPPSGNMDEEGLHPPVPFDEDDFKTKNATMIVELNE